MAKKQSKEPASSIDIGAFFGRYHAVIFAVTICGGLAVAVYLLMNIMNSSSAPEGYVPPSANMSFDTQTIERVEQLRPLSVSPSAPNLGPGRTDPFPQ